MFPCRPLLTAVILVVAGALLTARQVPAPAPPPASRQAVALPLDRARALETMKRATTFMVEKVAASGGYVWSYLAGPVTALGRNRGPLDHDLAAAARHALHGAPLPRRLPRDRRRVPTTAPPSRWPGALMLAPAPVRRLELRGRHRRRAVAAATGTTRSGRNAWRLEEFQHDWGNATFDDGGTSQSRDVPAAAVPREARPAVQGRARQGGPLRARQPVPGRRVAAAVSR